MQWDGLVWLIKCSTYWKYKNQIKEEYVKTNSNAFLKQYLEIIEITEIQKYNYFKKSEESGLPIWSEKMERLELIEWIYPVYLIYKNRKLDKFLSPYFEFEKVDNIYHEKNRFITDKLRTHIGVLLQIINNLASTTIPFGFEKKTLQIIKQKIEQQVILYLKDNIEDKPIDGKVDLFNYNDEYGFKQSVKEALLPQIARALNWFENKDEIIEAIASSNNINKILALTENITSEGIKNKLFEKIKQSNIQTFLESSHWISEIHHALLQIRNYPTLINQIELIVKFWESNNFSERNIEFHNTLLQTKMLIAYFHNDKNELEKIKAPESNKFIYSSSELTFEDYKDFYRGLLRLKDNPASSLEIFDKLSIQHPEYPVFAMNRMAAIINIANESDSIELFSEALEQWDYYKNSNPKINEQTLGSVFLTNKAYILFKLSEYDKLQEFYNNLEYSQKMLPEIIKNKTYSLIKQKRIEEALSMLEQAKSYHKFSDSGELEFIKELNNEVRGVDNIEELKLYYNRIFDSQPIKNKWKNRNS